MHRLLKVLFATLGLLAATDVSAQNASMANCTRSANFLACTDEQGNAYSVVTAGSVIYLRGFEAAHRRSWAQTTSRYGQLTFFTGVASNGEVWVGYSRRVGWTTLNRFSSSGGSAGNFVCGRLNGCQLSR
ncbi:glutamine synthetase [Pseudomonas citri]|uniref:glutamine synthetase n=1 Tax=Pseudomonas citri TaxID=2978349 RepID=UPI0021B6231B|nr:glutamine synthetase [Pseudomonas citri]